VFVVKINEHWVEVGKNRGVNGVESFVRHGDGGESMTK
jgi:hypothetical protein